MTVEDTEGSRTSDDLDQLAWLLRERDDPGQEAYAPPYGDVTELNTCRRILDSVGKDTLREIAEEAIDLLALVAAHPYTAYDQRQKSRKSLATLQNKVSPSVYADLIDAGAHRDLQEVIDELLHATCLDVSASSNSESTGTHHA